MENEQVSKKKFYKKWWFWVVCVVVAFIIVGSMGGSKEQSNVETSTTPEKATASTGSPQATQKSYQQVFAFSGTGTKKSEPFTITGDRFKIAYDCSGDPSATLCTAFVFKVGSPYPQGVMNSTKATKDETVIYTSMAGKGEYYIDANVLGNFTMTVYDYK